MMNLTELITKPICVICSHEWQKGYAFAQFEKCDNKYRLEDADFKYIHFRTLKNCTFYTDRKGTSDEEREVYEFDEFLKLIVCNV
jgi:hypothetical protein